MSRSQQKYSLLIPESTVHQSSFINSLMKYCFILAILFLTALSAEAQHIRRLLIFADDSTNVNLKTQRQWLETDKKGVEDRDIWIAVFHDPKTFRRMYDHYGVGRSEFYVILVDKDGTEKIRSEELVTLKELFEVIDGPVVKN